VSGSKTMIAAALLFRNSNPALYADFLLWRLKIDLNFDFNDLAAFSGIPPKALQKRMKGVEGLVKAGILTNLVGADLSEETQRMLMQKDFKEDMRKPWVTGKAKVSEGTLWTKRLPAIRNRQVGGLVEKRIRRLLGKFIDFVLLEEGLYLNESHRQEVLLNLSSRGKPIEGSRQRLKLMQEELKYLKGLERSARQSEPKPVLKLQKVRHTSQPRLKIQEPSFEEQNPGTS